MKKYPALALIELSNISSGIFTGDAIVKAAPVSVLKSGTVHNGKYLLLFGGSVASVEESYKKALSVGGNNVIDHVFLPNIHQQVHDGILGKRRKVDTECLGIFETLSVAAVIQSADAAIKGANVDIIEIGLADDIGGKGLVLYNGKLEEVEEALVISKEKLNNSETLLNSSLIPNIHPEMAKQIETSSIFMKNRLTKLEDGEL